MKKLAIYDLDDTLLCGDSEFHWAKFTVEKGYIEDCLLYTSPSPRDPNRSRMPSSA